MSIHREHLASAVAVAVSLFIGCCGRTAEAGGHKHKTQKYRVVQGFVLQPTGQAMTAQVQVLSQAPASAPAAAPTAQAPVQAAPQFQAAPTAQAPAQAAQAPT